MKFSLDHSPLLKVVFDHSQSQPDKIAIFSVSGVEISYATLWNNILKASTFLFSKGINSGDRILLSAQKEVEFIYFYLAAHLLGGVNVIVDASNSKDRNDYIAKVSNPQLSIGYKSDICDSVEYNTLQLPDLIKFSQNNENLNDSDTADIMFTSGTSGNPKGVLLSHVNVFSSASNINGFIGNSKDDIEFLGLPICHSFGLGRLRCNLLSGASVVLHNGFANLKSVFDTFEKYNVSGFGMVPAIFSYIKKLSGNRIAKFANQIRYIEIGSASMSLEDKILLCQLFPNSKICMHYGLTEASRAVFTEFHKSQKNLNCAGRAVNENVKLQIFDAEGNALSNFEEGEIGIKGNMVTRSYILPEDNKGSFIGDYFLTGDWGYLDDKGFLTLAGRKKEMINVGGKKVSPIEIEELIERECGVGECMCVAVPDPDGILGEVPKVLIVNSKFSGTIDEIKEKLKSVLSPYKMPREFEIVESIPKTDSGKKKRF